METAVQNQPTATIEKSSNTSTEEIQRLFDLQKANRQNIKNTTAKERKTKLKALKKAIFDNREAIQQALYNDFKKPAAESDLTEIYPTITEIKSAISEVAEWMRPKSVETPLSLFGTSSKLVYEPKGTTLIISPWNYPFQLCLIPLVSAIAAGNTAIVKPSEYTPHTAQIVKKVLGKVFNENEVAVVEGDASVSQELMKLKFDHIFFTGSPQVGKIVMRAAADHLASVTLELGGKSPVIVDETANIKTAAKRVTWGKFLNNGQTCIAPDYLLVHESKKDQFVEEMKKNIAKQFGETEEERKQSDDYCRIVNNHHFGRIQQLIEDAVDKGANVAIGGNLDGSEDYIAPTVLTDVPLDSRIMEEEIFGPVMPVLSYKNLDETLELINSKEKPLALYIFSKNKSNINKVLNHTSAGGTVINETLVHNAHPNLPFGGVNNSGIGSAHGLFGFKTFSHERGVMKQHMPQASTENMYPPYTNFVKKMIDFTVKYL